MITLSYLLQAVCMMPMLGMLARAFYRTAGIVREY